MKKVRFSNWKALGFEKNSLISIIAVALSVLFIASCSSRRLGPNSKGVVPNKCQDTSSARAEFEDVNDDSGATIISNHFRCVYEKLDPAMPKALDPEVFKAELKAAGTNSRKMDKAEQKREKAQTDYLKGKCPANWTPELMQEPFGWRCASEEIAIKDGCSRGTPRTVVDAKGKKLLLCLLDPKMYPQ